MTYILAIDQGTTSSRAIVFDKAMEQIATAQEEFPQYFPQSGWVEHDPEDLWTITLQTCKSALKSAGVEPAKVAAIGITNQRETTVVWDKANGKPIYSDCLARSPDGCLLQHAARGRSRGDDHRANRSSC